MAELFSTTFPGSTLPGTMSTDHRLSGSHAVSGGTLTLTTSATAESYGIARQTTAVAMADGDTATVRFVSTTGSGVVAFSLRTGAGDGTFMPSVSVNGGGNWFARVFRTSTGPGASLGTAGASAATNPWLRFRRSGTSCIAETAPDAAGSPGTWTTLYTWLAAETGTHQWTSSFTSVQIEVAAYTVGTIQSAVISRLGVSSLAPTDLQLRFTASGLTVDSAVMPVSAGGGGVTTLMRSTWSTATGTTETAMSDGGYWNEIYGLPTNAPQTLGVIASTSAPAPFARTTNVLRITQRGSTLNGTLQRTNALPLNASYYGQLFILNAGNTSIHNHPLTQNLIGSFETIPLGLQGDATNWFPFLRVQYTGTGAGQSFPFLVWGPGAVGVPGNSRLAHNTWYRYRWRIEILSTGAVNSYRIWPQVYSYNNASPTALGTLLFDANTYVRQDHTLGVQPVTLQAFYDAGNVFGMPNPSLARNVALGQEGSAGASDTGVPWYVGDFHLTSDGFPD